MNPEYTSAACNNCAWIAATGGWSILPSAQDHANDRDHRLTANVWADGERGATVTATVTIEPTTNEQPVYTSADCNDCDWLAGSSESNGPSILPLAQHHTDVNDHRLTAKAFDRTNRFVHVIATLDVEPNMTEKQRTF